MCKAEREWEREIENRGIKQGIEQGQNEMIKTLSKTMSVEDIARALGKTTAEIEKILKDELAKLKFINKKSTDD